MTYPIAIMDYGIGGIGLVSLIKKDYPDTPILYFSDSGEIPYGKLTYKVLKTRVDKVIHFLVDNGAQHVVIACHSASTVVESKHNITSIKELTIDSVKTSPNKSLAIIGGGRTIRARYYQKRFLKEANEHVKQRIAQQLSILVERGEVDSDEVNYAVEKILTPVKNYDRLLLACTHYPALKAILAKVMKTNCEIIDPIESIYHSIEHMLTKTSETDSQVKDEYFTSGDPELMKKAANNAFGFEIKEAKRVEL